MVSIGGLGVANVTLVSVQERTKEIGIKRAVGAKRFDVLSQFVVETFVVVCLGAAAGLLVALGILAVLASMPFKESIGAPVFSAEVAASTVFILAFVGFVSGMVPARHAASLNIAESLRD